MSQVRALKKRERRDSLSAVGRRSSTASSGSAATTVDAERHFGFAPVAFIDDVVNACNDYAYDGVDYVERKLRAAHAVPRGADDVVGPGADAVLEHLQRALDVNLDSTPCRISLPFRASTTLRTPTRSVLHTLTTITTMPLSTAPPRAPRRRLQLVVLARSILRLYLPQLPRPTSTRSSSACWHSLNNCATPTNCFAMQFNKQRAKLTRCGRSWTPHDQLNERTARYRRCWDRWSSCDSNM